MLERLHDDASVLVADDASDDRRRVAVRRAVQCRVAGHMCGVREDRVREGEFPVGRVAAAGEVGVHRLRERECGGAVAEEGVHLGEQHRRPHPVLLGPDLRPVPRRGVRGVEHLAILVRCALAHTEFPRAVVARPGEFEVPRLRGFGGFGHGAPPVVEVSGS